MENPRTLLKFRNTPRLPMIRQTEATECGLACIAMVAGFHGYKTDLPALRGRFVTSLNGSSLESLMEISGEMKLSPRALNLDIEHLKQVKTPCILHWNMNHFVVLKSVKANYIVVHDPAIGERRYKKEQFSKHFTGVVLELIPTKGFKQEDRRAKIRISDFWETISGLNSTLFKILTLSLLLQIFAITSPYYIQLVVDEVILNYDKGLLVVLAVGFGLLMLIELITNTVRNTLLLHLGNTMSIQLGANLFYHLVRLPLEYFEKRHIGDIVSRFGSLQNVKTILTEGVIAAFVDGLMASIILIVIFLYSPSLSGIVLLALSTYSVIRIVMYRALRRMFENLIVCQAKEQSNFIETVRGIQTIKLFGREIQRQSIWQNKFADSLNAGIQVGHINIGYEAINKLIFGIENILVIYLAAILVMNGELSIGMLIAFMAYKRQFSEKALNLIENLIEFKMLGLHFNRLADISLAEKESHQQSSRRSHTLTGEISVKNLTFRYNEKERAICSNLNASIKAGESVAIIGSSGCGKTTLSKLLLGLLIPEEGTIEVDGINIKHLGLNEYRKQIGAVMQNDQVLSGSISENISFFDPECNMKKVTWAAEVASIDCDIRQMTMGYNTLVGDLGSSLSGGQIQRILLARALYRTPKILFMDEATSNLDTRLEALVNNAIKELKITRIIIAHRPETIASADRVLELREGKLIEVTN